jgi:arginine repressor
LVVDLAGEQAGRVISSLAEDSRLTAGQVNSVAVPLDHAEWPEVVGTIAAAETILAITPDSPTGEAIQE